MVLFWPKMWSFFQEMLVNGLYMSRAFTTLHATFTHSLAQHILVYTATGFLLHSHTLIHQWMHP